MSYQTMRQTLMNEFNAKIDIIEKYARLNTEYLKLYKKKDKSLEEISRMNYLKKECWNISNRYRFEINEHLVITYPGFKTKIEDNEIRYDFRVNFDDVPVSHPEIILDLYNKALQQDEQTSRRWKNFLESLAVDGDEMHLEEFSDLGQITYQKPSNQLIEKLRIELANMGKSNLIKADSNFNFSLEQLKILIIWIALQEDMNYPINRRQYEGRRMPFKRYIEALYTGVKKQNLICVLNRAVVKEKRFDNWPKVDYSKIDEIQWLYEGLEKNVVEAT